jgi:hypothetical protein
MEREEWYRHGDCGEAGLPFNGQAVLGIGPTPAAN